MQGNNGQAECTAQTDSMQFVSSNNSIIFTQLFDGRLATKFIINNEHIYVITQCCMLLGLGSRVQNPNVSSGAVVDVLAYELTHIA